MARNYTMTRLIGLGRKIDRLKTRMQRNCKPNDIDRLIALELDRAATLAALSTGEVRVAPAAQTLGRLGGAARAAGMTPEARSAASSATAKARWAKTRAFTLYSGFHNQRVTVRGAAGTHANGAPAWTLTERQARRVEDALCGVRDCCCLSTQAGRIVVECEPACEYTRYEPGAGACIDLRDVPPEE